MGLSSFAQTATVDECAVAIKRPAKTELAPTSGAVTSQLTYDGQKAGASSRLEGCLIAF
jgi:hypothetical protein